MRHLNARPDHLPKVEAAVRAFRKQHARLSKIYAGEVQLSIGSLNTKSIKRHKDKA
jgi:hypothetical protein